MKVLVVGTDLTSNGGIASVVKTFYKESKNHCVEYKLLKTTGYKHGSKLNNLIVFIKAIVIFLCSVKSIDAVHLQGSSHGSFYRKSIFLILCKILGKPVIWNFHASRFEEFFLTKLGLRKELVRFLLNKADFVIVLSAKLKAELSNYYTLDNVIVLRNPVDPVSYSRDKLIRSTAYLKVIFLGFFIKNKGILDLIEAAKVLANDNIEFSFAGAGELQHVIDEASNNTRLNVINLGWLDSEDKYKAISDSDVLILPSYREGMPIVILEAMSIGVPVIATNIAAIPELIDDNKNGLLYEPGDLDGLVNCICRMKDADLRQKFSNLSSKKVENYYPDAVFKDLKKIYKEIVH
ncbi:glycosyltransferase family 4 protein [Shewanella sp. HL-SH2]|uniref:glycosyltransferase family 4 protein n=1 Tax=Shewanella sp. HL-SH2 TaxID=3436238 RepID=UPI003EBDC74B